MKKAPFTTPAITSAAKATFTIRRPALCLVRSQETA